MKKNLIINRLKRVAVFAALLLVSYACREEQMVSNLAKNTENSVGENKDSAWRYIGAPRAIEKAKSWYATNYPNGVSLCTSDGRQIPMLAEWSQAFATQRDTLEVVETDVMSHGRSLILDPECVNKYNETKDSKYMQCYTRLVFKTNRTTGITVGFLMTVVPNLEWLEISNFKPFMKVSYLFRNKEFGGRILFNNLDGSFSNGWVYEKGKITCSIKSMNASPPTK